MTAEIDLSPEAIAKDVAGLNAAYWDRPFNEHPTAVRLKALAAERDAAIARAEAAEAKVREMAMDYLALDGQTVDALDRAAAAEAKLAGLPSPDAPDWEGFGRDLLESWPVRDVDASELFDAALRNGLIREIPGGYDPDNHIDAECICPDRGDPWYEYAFRADLAAHEKERKGE